MTKYKLQVMGNFKQDVKRCKKRGLPLQELWDVVEMLLCGETLPVKFHVHRLHGNHADEWECHIRPDWLLVWEQHDDELILLFTNTGSHSDVFGKNKK